MRTLGRQSRVYEETEHTEAVVDRDEHHILGAPFLSVELGLRSEALTESAAMDPQCHGELLVHLAWSLRPNVQIQTVLTIRSLLAIAPLSVIATGILNGLIAGMTESVADLHTFPGHDGLWFLPTVLLDGRCSIGNAAINKHVGMIIGQYTLHLTAFDS